MAIVRATHGHDAIGPREMTVRHGDMLIVVLRSTSGWTFCENLSCPNSSIGWVPSWLVDRSNVEFVSMVRAIFPYDPRGPREVGVRQGDLINVLERHPSGWTYCINRSGPNCPRGWIPSWMVDTANAEKEESDGAEASTKRPNSKYSEYSLSDEDLEWFADEFADSEKASEVGTEADSHGKAGEADTGADCHEEVKHLQHILDLVEAFPIETPRMLLASWWRRIAAAYGFDPHIDTVPWLTRLLDEQQKHRQHYHAKDKKQLQQQQRRQKKDSAKLYRRQERLHKLLLKR